MDSGKLFELDDNDSDAEEENQAPESAQVGKEIEDLDLGKLFEATIKLGQTPIILEEKDQTQTVMVKICEKTIQEDKISQTSLDLVCLIDCSGSMNGLKMTQVKQTLVYMMELLQPTDRLAIVAFNTEAVILNSLRLANKENRCGRLLSNIERLTAVGGTNIVAGLKKALQILKKRETKNNVSSIFLLSDGNDNFELNGLDKVLEAANIENLTINTFGYGVDHDPDSLRKISLAKKGNFYYIKDLEKVDEAFVDCLALLTSVIGGKAKAEIKLIPTPLFKEISFKNCFGIFWKGDSDTSRVIDIGPLFIGMEKTFVAELVLDVNPKAAVPTEPEIKIAEMEFSLSNISTKDTKEYKIKKDLMVKIIKNSPEVTVTKDPEVEKQYLRVTGANILEATKNMMSKGNFDEAEKVLNAFKQKIEKAGMNDIVLDNLSKQVNFGADYVNRRRFHIPQVVGKVLSKVGERLERKYNEKEEERDYGHYMQQQAHALYNEQSAPEWNTNMYQNKRQQRMYTGLMHFKK